MMFFAPFLQKLILIFFYDIFVYSSSLKDHLVHLNLTLDLLRKHQLYAKGTKCCFGEEKVKYLGHLISHQGIEADPNKISGMTEWPLPTTVKSLRGFLGLTGYYRKFIRGYGIIAAPLTNMLKKNEFRWTLEATDAFNNLKRAMTEPPVLALPDFSKPFIIECDASGRGIGAVLMQEGRPIAFLSQALKGRTIGLSTYEKELLAQALSVQKWRPYLLGHHFLVRTDQQSLMFLLERRIGTPNQQKWLAKLLGYDFEVEYKKGRENKAADALSRKEEEGIPMALSKPIPTWIETVQTEYESNSALQELVKKFEKGELDITRFTRHGGLLFYKGRIYVDSQSPLRTDILKELHASPLGGYSGYHKTLQRVRADFFWHGLHKFVRNFVKECEVCKRMKGENVSPAGLLQPLPVPEKIGWIFQWTL